MQAKYVIFGVKSKEKRLESIITHAEQCLSWQLLPLVKPKEKNETNEHEVCICLIL